ncbi:MAG: PLP-dependent aspartate aminotransferase family protein [Thermoplasmata archaeon]|nr:PLP-dependent aspartate aminotransferase family protein [Thermoplasmata archaeon]
MRSRTQFVHAGGGADRATGAVNPPIHLSSTFAQLAPNRNRGYVYGRSANPTRTVLERALAEIEHGRTGLAFSSGLGALTTLLEQFPAGSRVVAMDDLYGGTWRLLDHHRRQFGLEVEFADLTTPLAVERALAEPADLVFVESPTNPLMKLVDLRALARAAHRGRGLLAVDNTFASPALQRPLDCGADVVLHSTTKYLSGHSDVIGGALVLAQKRLGERMRWLQNAVGAVPSPFDCFLVLRGIRTLELRMRAHGEAARAVAEVLATHRKVRAVHYPGLASHPQHRLARRQMSGFGGMLSAELRGGVPAARRFLRRVKLFTLAESLGGVESLVEHPALMTQASLPKADRAAHGITDGLLRFSCGIEDPADLADDVRTALAGV